MIQTSATGRDRNTGDIRVAVKTAICALFALVLLAACAPQREQTSTWLQQELQGKRLELVHERVIEEFSFGAEGSVNATFGEKGGPIAGPILDWRLENDVLIISEGPKGASAEELRLISVRGNVLTVKTKSGSVVKFQISKEW